MSYPASESWFSPSIRRNRKSFIIAYLRLLAIMVIVIGALVFFDVRELKGNGLFIIFFIPFMIAGYFLMAQRLRDFNVTGWLVLLWIPVTFLPDPFSSIASLTFCICLCAIPGTQGENRFGSDPLA